MEAGEQFTVCSLSELPEGSRLLVQAGDTEIGVFNVGGKIVAYQNRCAHQGGPVCRGRILGRWVEDLTPDKKVVGGHHSDDIDLVCPWHGWEYDILTGENIADRSIRLKAVPVTVRDGVVVLKAPVSADSVPVHE